MPRVVRGVLFLVREVPLYDGAHQEVTSKRCGCCSAEVAPPPRKVDIRLPGFKNWVLHNWALVYLKTLVLYNWSYCRVLGVR